MDAVVAAGAEAEAVRAEERLSVFAVDAAGAGVVTAGAERAAFFAARFEA